MLELYSERHVRTAHCTAGAMLELHSAVGRHVRIAQWGAMLELYNGSPC